MGDEAGEAPAARRPARTALVAAVVAVVAVAAVLALRRGVGEPDLGPTPNPQASPYPSLPPLPQLAFGEVCRPIRPAGRWALDVSFTLRNNSDGPATLLMVQPALPLVGLADRGYTIRAGGCAAPGRVLAENRGEPAPSVPVAPTEFVLATLHFQLPATCPAAHPVQAVVTERRDGRPVAARYVLLSDLGEVHFPTC